MTVDLDHINSLVRQRAYLKLPSALQNIEASAPSISDASWHRKALSTMVDAYYQIGEFEKAVEFARQYRGSFKLPYHYPTSRHYIRSLVALRLARRPAPYDEAYAFDTRMVTLTVDAVVHHFERRADERDQCAAEALATVPTLDEAVALLSNLHYYALPLDSTLVQQSLSRFPPSPHHALRALQCNGRDSSTRAESTRRYLFCGGTARSGTTAVGTMLNLSQNISIFTELYSPYLGYEANMFGYEALHTDYFSKKSHYLRDAPYRAKLSDATMYLGDKRPLFLNSWNITRLNFHPSDLKILTIVRDPVEIIKSYEKRAVRASQLNDAWQPDRGRMLAESDLSLQWQVIDEIQDSEFRSSLKLLKYPDILTDYDSVLDLFNFLEVPVDANLQRRLSAEIQRNQRFVEQHKPTDVAEQPYAFLTQDEASRYRQFLQPNKA